MSLQYIDGNIQMVSLMRYIYTHIDSPRYAKTISPNTSFGDIINKLDYYIVKVI